MIEPPSEPWVPEPTPTSMQLLGRTAVAFATRPGKVVRLQVRMLAPPPT